MRARILATVALLAAAGCTNAVSTPSPLESAAGASVAASATERPASGMELIGDQPVLRATDLGAYDAILPSAYFETDGVRHAYVVGFGQQPGDQKAFHATSADGVAWTIDQADPFADLGLDLSPPGPLPGSVLEAGGGWVMYLGGIPANQQYGSTIWRATATTAAGPWVADPDPVLIKAKSGAWDDGQVDWPSVIRTDDGYLMAYNASGAGDLERSSIGLARSADGISWERTAENPVVTAVLCGDLLQAGIPRLMQPDGGPFVLIWDAGDVARMATSDDAISWSCATEGPLVEPADLPESQGVHTIVASMIDGEISILVESLVYLDSAFGSEVWLARAWVE